MNMQHEELLFTRITNSEEIFNTVFNTSSPEERGRNVTDN